jgi:methionine-rich copper-binding protein CopC
MNKTLSLLFFLMLLIPAAASAHATPIEMQPQSGEQLPEAPQEISIRFSERLETESSRVRVVDAEGERVDSGTVAVSGDGYVLSTGVNASDGIYTTVWSVVSQDDGHFTRGSYAFSVGSSTVPSASSEQVVQIATLPEATLMFIEFLGNSILWGVLVLFVLSVRDARLRRVFSLLAAIGATTAALGAMGQLGLKSFELAGLHEIEFFDALIMYVGTAAGLSTIVRGAALFVGGGMAAIWRFRNTYAAVSLLSVALLVFAFFRAGVSHATANPFYPDVSIFVNFLHVIEKDVWLGVLGVFAIIYMRRQTEGIVPDLIPKVITFLSMNLAVLSLTAGYIVWLHLKNFSNLTESTWGTAFIPLACSGFTLVVLHSYHVLSLRFRPDTFRTYFSVTLGIELAAAILVVFFSSVVIITSPPSGAEVYVYSATDQGRFISLARAPFEDGMALLTVSGESKPPTVIIGEGEGGLQPALAELFPGGYVFPAALIPDDARVEIIAPQSGAYDARVVFVIDREDMVPGQGHGRTFSTFTIGMIVLSLAGAIYALGLRYIGMRTASVQVSGAQRLAYVSTSAIIAMIVISNGGMYAARVFDNEFKTRCLSDGNGWHIMQPTKAGVPVSGESREGCMLAGGQYHFADAREYEYLRTLAPAEVTLETSGLRAGERGRLTVALKESDGSPAKLSMEHERFLHLMVASADMRYFAHVHPAGADSGDSIATREAVYTLDHVFPQAGTYVIGIDYLHGLKHESRKFIVDVTGSPPMKQDKAIYYAPATFDGYDVSFDYVRSYVGNDVSLTYSISKNGKPVTDLEPYLAAAMHVAVVKTDLTELVHGHGEVHPPGYVYTPPTNGVHVHAPPPTKFGPVVEAHLTIPEPGFYTVYGEFKHEGKVVVTKFTLRIE